MVATEMDVSIKLFSFFLSTRTLRHILSLPANKQKCTNPSWRSMTTTFAANNTQILRVICRKVVYSSEIEGMFLNYLTTSSWTLTLETYRISLRLSRTAVPSGRSAFLNGPIIISSQELRSRYTGQ